jgi:hypothetical protein
MRAWGRYEAAGEEAARGESAAEATRRLLGVDSEIK